MPQEKRTESRGSMPKPPCQSSFLQGMKRLFDILFCLVFALPVLLLSMAVALAVLLEQKGPLLFRHERIGRGGKQICIYKFRTMTGETREKAVPDLLTENERALWERDQKLRNDPRVTPLGAFLRKYSLDELPQFLNVLRGDMSLIGPRPIVREEIEKYGEVFQEYCRVRPGLTGLWQVSGRNDLSYEERVALDHYYITSWSPALDITILLRTIPAVLSGKGAY